MYSQLIGDKPGLQSEFKARLGDLVKPCLKLKSKNKNISWVRVLSLHCPRFILSTMPHLTPLYPKSIWEGGLAGSSSMAQRKKWLVNPMELWGSKHSPSYLIKSQLFLSLPAWSPRAFELVTLLLASVDNGCRNWSCNSSVGWKKAEEVLRVLALCKNSVFSSSPE